MTTVQHSRYWLDADLFTDDETSPVTGTKKEISIQQIARYATVRRAIANFVNIVSEKNIPVEFNSGKQSYTDGQKVVIAAEDDPEKFDVMVGLALHEAAHILLSDFSFLQVIRGYQHSNQFMPVPVTQLMPKALADLIPPYTRVEPLLGETSPHNVVIQAAMSDLHMIMNILEDRRIDKYIFTRAAGYRPYYQALYNQYFFTKEIGRNLRFNPKWREITVENYINRLLYSFHPASDRNALPGLGTLIDMMDLSTIDRLAPTASDIRGHTYTLTVTDTVATMPKLWQEACALYAVILKYVAAAGKQNQTEPNHPLAKEAQQKMESDSPAGGLPDLDMDDMDLTPTPVEKDVKGKGKKQQEVDGRFNEKKAEKELADLKKFMEGDIRKKKMAKDVQASVTALEEAKGEMVDISGHGIPKAQCFVTRKLTDRLLEQDWFIFSSAWAGRREEANIVKGKRMGQILVQRLQVRNDPLLTKQTRLPHGGLDKRLLAQLGMEITSVFQKTRTDIHRPVMLHLSIDASGSMSGGKWDKVQTVATALAYLGAKMRNVDTVISIRGGNELPLVAVVFDSRVDQLTKFYRLFAKLRPAGATPEGLCFKATMNLITECATTHDTYFINFSDGEPTFYAYRDAKITATRNKGIGISYGGEIAARHTRAMVNMMKEQGVKVLSYFISEYSGSEHTMVLFRKMYGDDAVFVNVSNAGEVLVTLNRLLRERGT